MKYIDAEKLKAEIERRRLQNRYIDTDGYEEELLEIINSLQQEQPENGVDVTKFCKPINPEIAKCVADHWWEMLDGKDAEEKQSEVDLEKEIHACWQNWLSPSNQKEVEGVLPKIEFAMYARHFYELGYNARNNQAKA